MWREFKSFAFKGNVLDLAIAVVIGKAFGDIVSAIVADVFMPIIGYALPGGDWRNYSATSLQLKVGHVMGAVVDFFCIAFLMFLIVHRAMRALETREVPPPPNTKKCTECLEDIPREARRCRACTSVQGRSLDAEEGART
jgi:large conductance mechanosensitive channel